MKDENTADALDALSSFEKLCGNETPSFWSRLTHLPVALAAARYRRDHHLLIGLNSRIPQNKTSRAR